VIIGGGSRAVNRCLSARGGKWRSACECAIAAMIAGEFPAMSRRYGAGLIVILAVATTLTGCKPENKLVAPPPPEISVALPLKQSVTPFIVETGNTVAFNTVDLVARVEGFLLAQNYVDGSLVKKDDLLFQIDPTIYKAKVDQGVAEVESAKAQLLNAQAEFSRQETLLRQNVTAQNTYDQAKAKRDSAAANVDNQTANLAIAQANLGYTKVQSPFDGIATTHLVSVGELVGSSTPTKLATVVQLDPIYVTFNLSEQAVLRIRGAVGQGKPMTPEQLATIPIEIGLMTEEGFPHKGFVNYASPTIDTQTGTIMIRGLFKNPARALLPGFFVRVRVPIADKANETLTVPDRILGEDQSGKYLLVLNKDNVVEQRRVTSGVLLVGGMRAIEKGLSADDRVVLTTTGRAVPGSKVVPTLTTITVPSTQ
jgi:RND family efflux transporter MFP subunit